MKELAMKLLSMIQELTPAKSPAVCNKNCQAIKKQKETSPEIMPPRKKL